MKTLVTLLVALTLLTSACDPGNEPAETPPPPAAGCAEPEPEREPEPEQWPACDLSDDGTGHSRLVQARGCWSNTRTGVFCSVANQRCAIPGVAYFVGTCSECPAETKGGAQ